MEEEWSGESDPHGENPDAASYTKTDAILLQSNVQLNKINQLLTFAMILGVLVLVTLVMK
ncbi:MAG: hypothetical protein ACT4OG_07220 [Alphaproteobacteria bacterium]